MMSYLAAILVLAVQTGGSRLPQGIEYHIEARLDESTHVLQGRAELRYTNNAPAALDTLWLHQHLNAFRPNSAWARRELEFDNRRLQDLGPEEHAFDRFISVEIDGTSVQPVYPLSPDSTVAALPLPVPLSSGSTAVVRFDWEARLSTEPRRQGRSGRHYDFAQWYPRIAVYDAAGWQVQPLVPQGEFFGEFGTYDVVLDVAADQVIGATGVPLEGDPGWAGTAVGPGEIPYHRDAYGDPPRTDLGFLSGTPATGRKHVRWRAEDVHHFAWSTNPAFRYEGTTVERAGGDGGTIAIHVLYWPSDVDWANGIVTGRTATALDWLQEMFGPYPWPQLTNLHRIEPGGTEFPMMMMNGSPSEGLIVHESVHQYLHGILANNEFAEAWLDEGFTSFLTNWYLEEGGVAGVWDQTMETIRRADLIGFSEPIATAAAEFREPNSYSLMSYAKTDLVFRMLRWMIGEDTMRAVLRTLYDRHALSHLDESDLRQAVNDVTGEDLDWFFDQWLHTTDRLDFGITSATAEPADGGGWTVRVEVTRMGEAWMPVDLRVGDVDRRLSEREEVQVVEITTAELPAEAILDPDDILIDVRPENNRMAITPAP